MNDDHITQFKADIANMNVGGTGANRDPLLTKLGGAGMLVGVVLAVIAYFMSHSSTDPLEQSDAHILALIGIAVTVASAAIFIKASLTQFLRFWMARLIYEQRSRDLN